MCQFLMFHFLCIIQVEGKGKAHPRTWHEGPEGEWRYSSIFNLGPSWGVWSAPRHGRFTPGKDPAFIV